MNRFGHVIYYVNDVPATVAFFEKAFKLERDFIAENVYAQMKTGNTALGFAQYDWVEKRIPGGVTPLSKKPFATEISLCAQDVKASFDHAVESGCEVLCQPEPQPWGQTVGYVKTPDGILVEISSEMGE